MKRLLICGPIFNTPSGPSGMGGMLYTHLKSEGYTVYRKSAYRPKLLRLFDTLYFVCFKRKQYDVVLLQTFSNLSFLNDFFVTISLRLLGKKSVSTIHGGAFVEFHSRFPGFVNSVLRRSAVVTSPSHYIGQYLNQHGHKVRYVPNFIDTGRFPYKWKSGNGTKLLWVRAFTDIYKPEMAIRLISLLKSEFEQISLTMVGPDMGTLASCKSLISSLNLDDSIHITGPVPNHELSNYYAQHDVYINTTSYESFGMALVEAACTGIPIVSTEVGEIPYMWNKETEMLMVPDRDLEGFAQNVRTLLHDTALQHTLSANARVKAEQYSWDQVRQVWNQILETL